MGNGHDEMHRTLTTGELTQMLRLHQLWVESGGADGERANLEGAMLYEASLGGANLRKANLRGANLRRANFNGAQMGRANLIGANLRGADFRNCNVTAIRYDRTALSDKCRSVRLDGCYGNALFKRDVEDHAYIIELKAKIEEDGSRLSRAMFKVWGFIDYGRNWKRVVQIGVIVALLFGAIFYLDFCLAKEVATASGETSHVGPLRILKYNSSAQSHVTPWYFSVVTYTTLGFGDVTPASWWGELIVMLEVILGYMTLGLLISMLADRVVRRA